MRIVNGLDMLEIPANLAIGPGIVHPVLFYDKDEVILVDAGFPGQLQQFRESVENAGVTFERISKIIITHSDMDHIGGLSGIVKNAPRKIEVLAHEGEKPYIQTELLPIRLSQMESKVSMMPEEKRQKMEELCSNLRANYKNLKVMVDRIVSDEEELPYCGGIIVIHTPGHTPGHICLYHKSSRTLISGDVFNVENMHLVLAPEFTCFDKKAYHESLKKLVKYDIETVVCYHGGLYKDNAQNRIAELAGSQ